MYHLLNLNHWTRKKVKQLNSTGLTMIDSHWKQQIIYPYPQHLKYLDIFVDNVTPHKKGIQGYVVIIDVSFVAIQNYQNIMSTWRIIHIISFLSDRF